MDINNYIEPELFIIVPVLYVLGIMIKKSNIQDRFIPLILGIMGILLVTAYKLTAYLPTDISGIIGVIYSGITQGLLCAAASVYTNNIIKQLKKKDDTKGKSEDESLAQNDDEGHNDIR
ncbi:MAG: phage holin family protein [Clostridia bacterium]|nr:phage holin family protein [Clostridia bacterium]